MSVLNRQLYVQMKARRANVHLEALEGLVRAWVEGPPYTVKEWSDLEGWYYWEITTHPIVEDIPLSLGDFVCCLRAALDQLAWSLRRPGLDRREERQVSFLIFGDRDATYERRRLLFPPEVAKVFDDLQPYIRGDTYKTDPLWKLDELWRLDKHRIIPANYNEVNISLPVRYRLLGPNANGRMIACASRRDVIGACKSTNPVHLQPDISMEILFGEYMGEFEVSVPELRQIYNVVIDDVIPKFDRFFE